MSTQTIKFGVSFRGKPDYTYTEVSNFIECAYNIGGENNLEGRYIAFLNNFLEGKIKTSTQVDLDVMQTFQCDVDNRAQIDYREDHWDDDLDILAGGKYFDSIAKKLKTHIAKCIKAQDAALFSELMTSMSRNDAAT